MSEPTDRYAHGWDAGLKRAEEAIENLLVPWRNGLTSKEIGYLNEPIVKALEDARGFLHTIRKTERP